VGQKRERERRRSQEFCKPGASGKEIAGGGRSRIPRVGFARMKRVNSTGLRKKRYMPW